MQGHRRYEDEERYERGEERHGNGHGRAVAARGTEDRPAGRELRHGDWYGYVQPYRYYGPGYRGVGYYSVMYQGGDPEQQDYGETESGEIGETGQRFDERAVKYGQGQGTGAAWVPGGSGHAYSRWGWQGRGRYSGMGPKGYKRSDERIKEDVSDRLMEHPDLDASDVEVKVSKGEVTLSGTVDSRWAKRLAEDLAESSSGVREVMNHLRVGSESVWTDKAKATTESTRSRSSVSEREPAGQSNR
jgi:osmotically-inducible protein OsmY